jgi:hypothetical protein
MTEQEARDIYHQGEEVVVAKLMEFDARLKRLEEIIGMNSTNSSKPPSTDNKLTKTKKPATSSSKKKRGAHEIGVRTQPTTFKRKKIGVRTQPTTLS